MQTFAKLIDGQLTTTCADPEDADMTAQILADGFKPYDEDAGQPEAGEFETLTPVYFEEEDKISLYWEIVDNAPEVVNARIARLEGQLAATDYQVVKSFEYSLAGEAVPYDIAAIHTEREELREKIRELELLLISTQEPEPEVVESTPTLPEFPLPIEPVGPDDEIPSGVVSSEY